jgi:hypothetical protein
MEMEISKDYAVERVNSNQVDDGLELQSRSKLGGTAADEREMQTLGRTQQLNASITVLLEITLN